MQEVRIIVAGGRDFQNSKLLFKTLKNVLSKLFEMNYKSEQIIFVSGTAKGADSLGEFFANTYKYKVKRFPADWDRLGKRAGYVRNEQMAKYASENGHKGILIAFWDGQSRGTKHMIDLANKYGLKFCVVSY